ncbi:MAG: polysaccharide biosynthesis tyrosine autokinase [Proteobacteria bacterium]|nr:polysaccharide biosynthesis tyrosine autokinase [Pseudomonadota bacterium]
MNTHETRQNGSILRTRTRVTGHDFLTVCRFIERRKWLPCLGFVVGSLVAMAILALSPPLYSASSRIMIDTHQSTDATVVSEMQIIRSTPVLSKVAGTLGLYKDPRFVREGLFESIMTSSNAENALRARVLFRLDRMLHVQRIDGTSIIELTVRHPNPERAAQIANVVLSAYRERKMDERFEQSRQIGEWMNRQIDALKMETQSAKKRLEDFRIKQEANIGRLSDAGHGSMEALQKEILVTQDKIKALEARLKSRKSDTAVPSASLKADESRLVNTLDGLLQRYGEKHPKVLEARRDIANVRARMSRKTVSTSQLIEAEIAKANRQVDALQSELEAISKNMGEGSRFDMQLQALEAEVRSNERLQENLLLKYQDMVTQSEFQEEIVRVVSMATIPSKPDMQERVRFTLIFGFAGFLIAFSSVVIRALWNTGFTSVDQLESLAGYPVFAAVPNAAMKGVAIHHTIIEKPAAIMAEALRSLRVALRLRSSELRGPRVVAFTSTLPDEGKTSLAVMLAMIAAKSGERVVVVDCDLRRPSLHKAFGIGNARGLQDYLSNNAGLDDAIYRRDPSGVHVVTAKSVPTYSLTLLTSGRMEQMVEALREQYDLVILDAPSSLAFADARVLARMVDQVLYVVSWGRTRRQGVLNSLKAYADMGYEDLALVLNKVDLREYLRESASAVIYQYGYEDEGDRLSATS